jgi:hypothetical protein
MTQSLDYHCKFCDQPGHIEFEQPELVKGKEAFNVIKYIPILCCDRCGRYQRTRRDLHYAICQTAAKLFSVRYSFEDEQSADRMAMEEKTRIKLVRLTKRLAKAVCDFWRKPFAWEPDLVDAIMNQPTYAGATLRRYLEVITREPKDNP